MGNVFDEYRSKLEARMEELRPAAEEYEALKRILAGMKATAPESRPTKKRIPLPERKIQIVELVKEHPGITAKELSERLGVTGSRITQVLNELVKDDRVTRREGGVQVKAN